MMCLEDIINRGPGGLNRILAGKQRAVAYHGVM